MPVGVKTYLGRRASLRRPLETDIDRMECAEQLPGFQEVEVPNTRRPVLRHTTAICSTHLTRPQLRDRHRMLPTICANLSAPNHVSAVQDVPTPLRRNYLRRESGPTDSRSHASIFPSPQP